MKGNPQGRVSAISARLDPLQAPGVGVAEDELLVWVSAAGYEEPHFPGDLRWSGSSAPGPSPSTGTELVLLSPLPHHRGSPGHPAPPLWGLKGAKQG